MLGYSRWAHVSTDPSQVPSAKIQKGSCYSAQPWARECPSQSYNRHGVPLPVSAFPMLSDSKPTRRCCHPVLQKGNLRVRKELPPLKGREPGSDPALSGVRVWALSKTSICKFQNALGEWHRQEVFNRVYCDVWKRAGTQELKTRLGLAWP